MKRNWECVGGPYDGDVVDAKLAREWVAVAQAVLTDGVYWFTITEKGERTLMWMPREGAAAYARAARGRAASDRRNRERAREIAASLKSRRPRK